MAAYTAKVRDDAFLAYVESGNIEATARLTGLPSSTLAKWRDRYGWEEKRTTYQANLPVDQTLLDKQVQKLCDLYNMDEERAQTLKDVKMIEARCMAAINGTIETTKRQMIEETKGKEVTKTKEDPPGLYPHTFDGAMRALKICWDTRLKIFGLVTETKNGGTKEKPDFFQMVKEEHHYHGDVVYENSSKETGRLVPRQSIDMER